MKIANQPKKAAQVIMTNNNTKIYKPTLITFIVNHANAIRNNIIIINHIFIPKL